IAEDGGACAKESTGTPQRATPTNAPTIRVLRTFMRTSLSRSLPAERDTDERSVEVHVFDLRARFEVVVKIAPSRDHIAQVERIAKSGDRLPRQVGVTGADVGVIGNEPFASFAECESAFHS